MPVALHHRIDGPADAPVLLLGGSLGTTLAMWDPLLPLLTDRLRVVRYDARGHGQSPVPAGPYSIGDLGDDVIALLDTVGVERAHFGGLSIGGMVGQWLGVHAADRFDSLTLMCTASYLDAGFAERAATVREAGSVAPLADAVIARWLTPDHAAAHPEQRDWLLEMLIATPAGGYAACCDAIGSMDLREDLASISTPTLVISAANDPSIPPEHQRALADAIPGARLETIEPAAHVVAVERPEAVAALILDHVGA